LEATLTKLGNAALAIVILTHERFLLEQIEIVVSLAHEHFNAKSEDTPSIERKILYAAQLVTHDIDPYRTVIALFTPILSPRTSPCLTYKPFVP